MSRPEYPNCIMTPGVIRGVRERQEAYDKNPAEYEREERQYRGNMQREKWDKWEMEQADMKA